MWARSSQVSLNLDCLAATAPVGCCCLTLAVQNQPGWAAALVGYLAEKNWDRSLVKMFVAAILGAIVLYIPGLLWLHQFASGWPQTMEWGLTPFVAGDLVKAALVALGFQGAWNLLGKKA